MTLGDRVGPDYIITDGAKAADRVIVEGIQKARPNSTVKRSDEAITRKSPAREKERSRG